MNRSTRRTVMVAGAANIAIAVTKLAAGIAVGSAAMLAEAAHSLADTLNQGFLLTSLHRSDRPADPAHPFGYGKERYFWSLLAAVGIFVAGAGFSVFEGVLAIGHGGEAGSPNVAYLVLAVAFVAEGSALSRAVYQVRREAARRDRSMREQVRRSRDTTVRTALFEDVTALIGLLVAAAGLTLRELTGSAVWDGAASIAIGLLLVAVAYSLGRTSMHMLIGQAAEPEEQRLIKREIEATPGIDRVLELLTMQLGPDDLIVGAKVAFTDDISADHAEDLADDVDRRLRERLPTVRHVFLDPTQLSPSS
ncbi:MAG TPA: cation diffusion facilitator family transporter [Streptosporangiaceae bacterium]|nr:cation diffusion facilitator family transporter [Streptosporangiaceae bacterium]